VAPCTFIFAKRYWGFETQSCRPKSLYAVCSKLISLTWPLETPWSVWTKSSGGVPCGLCPHTTAVFACDLFSSGREEGKESVCFWSPNSPTMGGVQAWHIKSGISPFCTLLYLFLNHWDTCGSFGAFWVYFS